MSEYPRRCKNPRCDKFVESDAAQARYHDSPDSRACEAEHLRAKKEGFEILAQAAAEASPRNPLSKPWREPPDRHEEPCDAQNPQVNAFAYGHRLNGEHLRQGDLGYDPVIAREMSTDGEGLPLGGVHGRKSGSEQDRSPTARGGGSLFRTPSSRRQRLARKALEETEERLNEWRRQKGFADPVPRQLATVLNLSALRRTVQDQPPQGHGVAHRRGGRAAGGRAAA